MTTAKKLLSTQTGGNKLYVDDVFSTYLYTGNGSTQTINNGIDLAGKGGLVWLKVRSGSDQPDSSHILDDTVRGAGRHLYLGATSTYAEFAGNNIITSFSASGFNISDGGIYNSTANSMASWTFRRAPKFFDIVTYTGDGTLNRAIPHSLGVVPGFVITKCTSNAGDWNVWHRSIDPGYMRLNTPNANAAGSAVWGAMTETSFSTGSHPNPGWMNENGQQYVAYLWAHDPSEGGIVQCGSYVGNGNGAASPVQVNLGFEPQFVLIKNVGSGTAEWVMFDSMRGLTAGASSIDSVLYPNSSTNENPGYSWLEPTATGFNINSNSLQVCGNNQTHIYLAIRRSNKPPTTGTEVYNAIARTGTGAAATVTGVGFAPDFLISKARNQGSFPYAQTAVYDKLRGKNRLLHAEATGAELSDIGGGTGGFNGFTNIGVELGTDIYQTGVNYSGSNYINHFFRRAPGFFDVVCYTGTSGDSAGEQQNVKHNLAAIPELVIVKARSTTQSWYCYAAPVGPTKTLYLMNANAASSASADYWDNTTPTDTYFRLGLYSGNSTGQTYVAYLFASLPGISKVGSYTGNGTSLSVECGFSTGARFILAKSVDAAGDWFIWDTARGIVAANDPHLSLNTTEAEVTTDDSVDPYAGGFIVNQNTATNINISGKRYIFLAIA